MKSRAFLLASITALFAGGAIPAFSADLSYEWYTVANNGDQIPGTTKLFNSYNQPSVNDHGMVVFRARSRGGQGQPEHGIYIRDLDEFGPLSMVFRRGATVPQPNNALYNGKLAQFNEFPSVPRIDSGSDTIATRGMSQPIWQYTVNGGETRTGSAGVYANPKGVGTTAASMLGDVPGFDYFQVPIPEVPAGTGFDQFPGAPSVTERTTVVFKGNFAVGGVGKTGVFYRDVKASGGKAPIELIASAYDFIPGTDVRFGSTAPPSAAAKTVVFAGYDVEAAPTAGGIYLARLGNKPIVLEAVVTIGDPVPDEPGQTFRTFGEAVSLSSNGRHVMFWGTWGDETRDVIVSCPAEGNAALQSFCHQMTDGLDVNGKPMNVKQVPVNQGFFVRDLQLGKTLAVAKTDEQFRDFLYWKFSGRAPGMGEGESDDIEEPARWRTSAFAAVSGRGTPYLAAFRAQLTNGTDGIYLRQVHPSRAGDLLPFVVTGMPAVAVDPEAPAGAVVTSVGLERDGFRAQWLALTVTMAVPEAGMLAAQSMGDEGEAETNWAGIYAARFFDPEEETP
jgi:hypothetical protein